MIPEEQLSFLERFSQIMPCTTVLIIILIAIYFFIKLNKSNNDDS